MNRDQSHAGSGPGTSSYYELLKVLQLSSSSPGQDLRRLISPVSSLSQAVSGSNVHQDLQPQFEPNGRKLIQDRTDFQSGHISRRSIGSGNDTVQGSKSGLYGAFENRNELEWAEYAQEPCRTLLGRNFQNGAPIDSLRRIFGAFGEILECINRISSRGVIYVTYYDIRSAEAAKINLHKCEIDGRRVEVHYFLPREDDEVDRDIQATLLVTLRKSSQAINDDEVRRKFQDFGDIRSIRRLEHSNENSRRRCVEFYDIKACQRALNRLHHQRLQDGVMDLIPAMRNPPSATLRTEDSHREDVYDREIHARPHSQHHHEDHERRDTREWSGISPATAYNLPIDKSASHYLNAPSKLHVADTRGQLTTLPQSVEDRLTQARKLQQVLELFKVPSTDAGSPIPLSSSPPAIGSRTETNFYPQQYLAPFNPSSSYEDQTAGLPCSNASARTFDAQGQHARTPTLQDPESSIILPSEVLALLQQTTHDHSQRRAPAAQVLANEGPFQQIGGALSTLPAQAVAVPPNIRELLSYFQTQSQNGHE